MSEFEPRFGAEQLRECATPSAVERVWSRLETETEARRAPSRRVSIAWGVAFAATTFTLGLWLGRSGSGQSVASGSHEEGTSVFAEPTRPAAASGAQSPGVNGVSRSGVPKLEKTRRVPSQVRGTGPLLDELSIHDVPLAGEPSQLSPLDLGSVELPPAAVAQEPPRWQRFANSGEYEAALFEIGQAGGFETVLSQSDAEQLMLLADVARATGQRQRALAALRRILVDFRGGQTAPLAAYSLGNMLEKAGDAQAAAEAFAVYRQLSPRGDFAADALVRELRSAVERGEQARALQLLSQYENDFPDALHNEELATLRARLRVVAPSADAGAPQPSGEGTGVSPEPRPGSAPTE